MRRGVVAVAAVLLAAGCGGDGRPRVYPVGGTVTVRGAPAAGAYVLLHAKGGDPKAAVKPNAVTDAAGAFRLTTYASGDGAPPGEYALTVVWPAPTPNSADGTDTGADRLAGRYADPARPARAVTVTPGDNALGPIDLR